MSADCWGLGGCAGGRAVGGRSGAGGAGSFSGGSAAAVASGDYRRGFAEAAKFGPAVDRFFTDVFVMVDDAALKSARLSLMKRLEQVILSLADISEIVAE